MKVIKRNGVEVEFDPAKIVRAISAANRESDSVLSDTEIKETTEEVVAVCTSLERQEISCISRIVKLIYYKA
jgi:transcriptional regulator NrdR family protein